MLNVIKRNGEKVAFEKNKIERAILMAMTRGSGIVRKDIAKEVANEIEEELINARMTQITIHTIEYLVYIKLTKKGEVLTAKAYEEFRAIQSFKRACNTTDEGIIGLINGSNSETINENSNKNAAKASTQRDLIAGEVSKDIARRKLVPAHIIQAHDAGLLHLHDMDYMVQPIANCCLINLKDMFENGTVINGKLVTTPRSFRTACTVMTQIFAQVASGQYGGQSANITHLAPYLRASKEKLILEVMEEYAEDNIVPTEERLNKRVMKRLAKELRDGVQTMQYQINTLLTSNGQSPFVTLFMYINDDPEYEEETAMITEEIIKQRLKGIQNEQGVWVTPSFPKILYVLDENNAYKDTKYYHITKLAAKCVMKRMMPDFISAKKMRENYGAVFSPMGK